MKAWDCTYEVSVDWIDIEVQIARQSNFWSLQSALQTALQLSDGVTPFVAALDSGSGNAASCFRVRIQNPLGRSQLVTALAEIQRRFGLVNARPLAIEVAFDTYHAGGTVRSLAEVATDRFRFITATPGDDWYFYRKQNEGRQYLKTLPQRRDIVKCFEQGWQLTDSNSKQSDVRYHAYVKTHDGGQSLIPSKYCARLEVTLSNSSLALTVEELVNFNFTRLAKFFKFRRLADDLHPAAKTALSYWSGRQYGRSGKYRRPVRNSPGKYSGTSVFRTSTVADEELNAAAYECLRKLTRSWRRPI